MGWIRRRAWLIVVTTLLAAGGAHLMSLLRPPEAVANMVLLVRSGATRNDPGSAGEATRLALTLSNALAKDDNVLSTAAEEAELSRAAISKGLSVTPVAETSLIEVEFRSDDEATAIEVTESIAEVVTGPDPDTAAVPPGGLSLVSQPAIVDPAESRLPPMAVGAVSGLVLGALIVAIWERADPRVDNLRQLEVASGLPTSDLRTIKRASAQALLKRWKTLAPTRPLKILFLGIDDRGAASRIAPLFDSLDPGVRVLGSVGEGAAGGTIIAEPADLAVLVAAPGARVERFEDAARSLSNFSLTPVWALLVSRRKKRHVMAGASPAPKTSEGKTPDRAPVSPPPMKTGAQGSRSK